MQNNLMNPKVDFFFDKESHWKAEYQALRMIVLDCGLNEELKWGCPCYLFKKNNIVLIHGFKDYCALLFFKGSLMSNSSGLLIQQSENVQAARQIRFRSVQEITALRSTLKALIYEAVELEKTGQKVEYKKTEEFKIPEEFQKKLNEMPQLKNAFGSLTPGRQRAYIFYFSQAKQSKTRESRIEKCIEKILNGKGLED
jgi:uncharacterized protein YdeI (YjbR/CyaY-like superfamily)